MKSNLSHLEKLLIALCMAILATPAAQASGFAATVSPPRFELFAKPGEILRESVEISNSDTDHGKLQIAHCRLGPDR